MRALELLEMGEEPAAALEKPRLWKAELRRPTLLCGLVMEREALYEAIDRRVDADGRGRRARPGAAARTKLVPPTTARKALGFEELLRGDVEGMKRRTRNYAKRQLTWMRKLSGLRVIDVTGLAAEDVAAQIAADTG